MVLEQSAEELSSGLLGFSAGAGAHRLEAGDDGLVSVSHSPDGVSG
ncbi:MAG: hypothetical protein IPL62_18530 [Caulobacteraceae bacterium]|nr:hypothetical protein [Caulobacteraceae bacterium]